MAVDVGGTASDEESLTRQETVGEQGVNRRFDTREKFEIGNNDDESMVSNGTNGTNQRRRFGVSLVILICACVSFVAGAYFSRAQGLIGIGRGSVDLGELDEDEMSVYELKEQGREGYRDWIESHKDLELSDFKQWTKEHDLIRDEMLGRMKMGKTRRNGHDIKSKMMKKVGKDWSREDFMSHFNDTMDGKFMPNDMTPMKHLKPPAKKIQQEKEANTNDGNDDDDDNADEDEDEDEGEDEGEIVEETDIDEKDFVVLARMNHDTSSFTEGLSFHEGIMYETTGLWGKSKVIRTQLSDNKILASKNLDAKYFGEGSTYYGDNKLIEITWKAGTGFIFDATTLDLIRQFEYKTSNGEGWGITHDPINKLFYVTDGSTYLHVWDDETLIENKRIPVTDENGHPIKHLNELEYTSKGVLANIWYSTDIILIDPLTGKVKKRFDFSSLKAENGRGDVLNGISTTHEDGIFFVTGKNWHTIYRVKIKAWNDID